MMSRLRITTVVFTLASSALFCFMYLNTHKDSGNYKYSFSGLSLPACLEVKHIYFLKVFKTGSTTVQNICLRYGFTNNAAILVLKHRNYAMGSYPMENFTELLPARPSVLRAAGGRYDIYCEHSVYNENMLQSVLHRDTVNIASVREPLSRLRSAFEYFKMDLLFSEKDGGDAVVKYLQHPDSYAPRGSLARHMTQNTMARQFGYRGKGSLPEYLKYIESKFLVLIVERMAESLVLMRRKLCWNIKDILHFQMRKISSSKPAIANQTIINLNKAFSPWDYAFYAYFQEVMEQRILHQQPDFADEVMLFQAHLRKTSGFCDKVCYNLSESLKARRERRRELMVPILENYIAFEATRYHNTFSIFGYECLMMKFDPEVYRKALRQRYYPNECTAGHSRIVDTRYCRDYFKYNFPWDLIEHSRSFVSPCVE